MSCPVCGSQSAIPKHEAWDALCTVPPKVAKRLNRLEKIADISRELNSGEIEWEAVTKVVSADLLERLLVAVEELKETPQ